MKKLNKKMNESSRYNDTALQKLMALVEQYGNTCRALGFMQGHGDKWEQGYTKQKSKQLLDDIKEHATPYMAYTAYDGKEEFDESDESQKSEWFHKIGRNSYELTKPIPGYCVVDCSGSGSKDDEVAMWVDELKFDIGLPRDAAIEHLEQYGAWNKEELESKTDNELAQILLFLFCEDIYEQAHEMAEDEPDVEALGDPSDWDDDIWEKFQREYSCGCYLNG